LYEKIFKIEMFVSFIYRPCWISSHDIDELDASSLPEVYDQALPKNRRAQTINHPNPKTIKLHTPPEVSP